MNIFQQFTKSLYSPKDIAKLRFQTIGKVIVYVFLITLLSIVPASIYSSQEIYNVTKNLDEILTMSLPDFEIKDGELITFIKEPTTIVHNNIYILLDPTGEWSSDDLSQYNQSIGIFKDEIAYHFGASTQSIPYNMLQDITITKEKLTDYIDTFLSISPIIISLILIASYIFSAGVKFIEVSIIAFFGLSFSRLMNKPLPYRRLWVISAYAITLPVTFLTIMEFLKITVISSFGVYWLVSLIMLYLALKEIPGKNK